MFGAIAGGIDSAIAGGAMSKWFSGGQKAASGGIQGDVLATDNNTVGMGDGGIKSAISDKLLEWLDLVASLPLIKERILVIILLLHFLSLMLGSVLVLMLPLL